MPVVEITQLRLKGLTVHDPALLESLSLVRGKLHTNSRFFSCIEDSSLIYIFGFLASPLRDEVLAPQEELLDFQWTVHLEHNEINPLMLGSPFIAIERLGVDLDHVAAYDQIIDEHVRELRMNPSLSVAHGRRCDDPTGSQETIILTSSSSPGPHPSFAVRHAVLCHCCDDKGPYREIMFTARPSHGVSVGCQESAW
ncbi:hypothetical protein EJ07DRAFT_166914 [Lizonia empirigonia]|nr:hypothetical protein EJ07DRAFT_166914 [Lizonia empirigonia]